MVSPARRGLVAGLWMMCLVFALICSFLWVRSLFRLDDISYSTSRHIDNFSSHRGRIFIELAFAAKRLREDSPPRYRNGGLAWDVAPGAAVLAVEPKSDGWKLAGFDLLILRREVALIIPWWAPIAIAGIAPLRWLILASRTRGRVACGRCVLCGYDLRASRGQCPECGALQNCVADLSAIPPSPPAVA